MLGILLGTSTPRALDIRTRLLSIPASPELTLSTTATVDLAIQKQRQKRRIHTPGCVAFFVQYILTNPPLGGFAPPPPSFFFVRKFCNFVTRISKRR